MSSTPVIPAPATVLVPVACDEVCARIALRPPTASICRSMIERAVGRDAVDPDTGVAALTPWAAGAGLDGAGACGACALSAEPAETTAASPTAARPDTTRPCRNIEMRMFESSVKKGGAGAILPRDKGKGKGKLLLRNAGHDAEHVMQLDLITGFEVSGHRFRSDPGE